MKGIETTYRKPSLNKVTIAKLNSYSKGHSKKDISITTISQW